MSVLVDLQRRSGPVERLALSGLVLVGRQDGDIVVDDPAVSRRHIELIAAPDDTLVVRDLGSSNGTYVNGQRVTGETPAPPGTEIRLGDTIFTVIGSSDPVAAPAPAPVPTPDPPASPPAQPPPSGHEGAPTPAPAPTPAGHDFDVITTDEVEVRFRPGSYGEQLAPSVARSVKRARHNLEGVGAEAWGLVPIVSLVDPYLSADGSGELIASGTIVDAPGNQIWMIVSPEAPPEDPHRALALLFGAALPSAAELEILLEGYGLHRSGITDTDEQLRGRTLPHLDDATGELRGLMAVSFVRDLIRREGQDSFRRLLAAPKGKVDDTTRSLYGAPLTQLEGRWLAETATGEIEVDTAQFLRLSLRYLKPYKLRQAEIFVYMLLSLAFTASFPFVTRKLFDDAIPSGEFSEVVTLLVILGVAFVISLVAGVRQAYQSAWVSGAVTRDLRQTLFDRLQRLPASWYHQHPQGDVLSRLFSDVAQVEDGLSTAISQGIFQVISLVVSAAIMLTINLPLALVVLAGAPLVAVVYRGMAKGAQDRSVVVQENSSALMGVAAENNSAAGVVKVFGLASREKRRFGAQANRLFRSERRLQLWGGLFGLSVNLIVTSLRLFVLGFGAWLILEGHFTLGGLVAFLSIMGEVLSPVTVLTTLGQTVQQSMGSLVRINEVLDEPTEADDASLPALAPLGRDIRLVEVGFGYTPQQRALDGLDVSIPVGSRLAFVGPSGSGKSTVLRLLMRMYDPDEGAVLVDGVDLRSCSVGSWRDQLGVVFQDSFLFDTTLRENIALGKVNASEEEVLAAARAAEIDTFVESLERGYDTVVGEGGGSLSGGQRQRVAIARALIRNPRLLLLDEATSALDPGTEKQINETLLRVSKDRTVVAITHRLTSVVDYDRIFVIVAGELSEQGTHEELVALGGVYAHLWSEQTGAAIPESPPVIDAAEALRRVPLFAALDDAALAEVAGRLRPFPVEAGEVVADGGGLVLVESGRLDVVAVSPTATGVAATLGPGDTFGLASVMGAPATSSLSALAPSLLQLLSTRAIAGLAAEHPSIGEALTGVTDAAAVSGTRLSRLTLGPGVMLEEPRAALPNARAEMTAPSRATGAFTVPRR